MQQVIGNYRIVRFIAKGGMADVYEAEHIKLGTRVAIKILNPLLLQDSSLKERFVNEAKIISELKHPNIVQMYEFIEQGDINAIVLEYLEGQNLYDYVSERGALPDEEVIRITKQIISALEYAHSKGIVHRDLKPSNVFILRDGTVKILDFGIAKVLKGDPKKTQTLGLLGTPRYMSPEQILGKPVDHRTDIYTLGLLVYFMVTGEVIRHKFIDEL